MISIHHRFLFIHVPKTGGNSVQNVLDRYSDDSIVRTGPHHDGIERFEVRLEGHALVKHSTLGDYQAACGHGEVAKLFKFICVRNPWDRCVSHYFSPHRGRVSWDRENFVRLVESSVHPIARYISDDNIETALPIALGNIDHVMRFETLSDDFDAAMRKLSLPPTRLPRRNASDREDYRKYYDRETIDLVSSRFSEEITQFGYAFD